MDVNLRKDKKLDKQNSVLEPKYMQYPAQKGAISKCTENTGQKIAYFGKLKPLLTPKPDFVTYRTN